MLVRGPKLESARRMPVVMVTMRLTAMEAVPSEPAEKTELSPSTQAWVADSPEGSADQLVPKFQRPPALPEPGAVPLTSQ